MQFVGKRFHFSVATFPLAVLGVVGLVQLVPKLLNNFSGSIALVAIACVAMIWIWKADSFKYANYPPITITTEGIAIGDCHVTWAVVKSMKVVARALDQHVAIEIEDAHLSEQNEDCWFPTAIQLVAYQNNFALLKSLKENFESARPNTKLDIPSSSVTLFASWLVALFGSTALVIALLFAMGFIGWWLYLRP